jgi:tetratricopeptide (TPR) repeat protein
MLENMDKAIEIYSNALKLNPDDGVTYWERGACYNDKPFLHKMKGEEKSNF